MYELNFYYVMQIKPLIFSKIKKSKLINSLTNKNVVCVIRLNEIIGN